MSSAERERHTFADGVADIALARLVRHHLHP
jgi:hypothetical protein